MLSCDTSVVLGSATADGSVIFAKNSDRPANECQPLMHVPRRHYPAGATLRCQYIDIPQVAETWELIGSRPYWLWGFEMGVNEWGVAIGNEAVHPREPDEARALIGMDLVRLGLERGRTADEALHVIGELVERHGQGGSCDAHQQRTYHNSFIIADPLSAWVLETAGHHWFARRVRERAAISNLYTIGGEWDAASPRALEHARRQGWGGEPFSFAAAYQDPATDLSTSACRLDRARAVLDRRRTGVTLDDLQSLLGDHAGGDLPTGEQEQPTICMHVSAGRSGETAGAMIAQLRPDRVQELAVTCWAAFGSPCLSVFLPLYPRLVGIPESLQRGGERYDPASPWWVFEHLQRIVAQAPSLAPHARASLAALQHELRTAAAEREAEAQQFLARGERDRAIAVLSLLVDESSERAVDLARQLIDELAPSAPGLLVPAMRAVWDDLNARVELPALALAV